MQGGQGGRHGLFGFGGPFGGFGDPFAGFGHPESLMPSFFGGANPFDDPFFTNPFGSMMQPRLLGPSMLGPQGSLNEGMGNAGMFGPSMFGPQGSLNGGIGNAGMFGPSTFGLQGLLNGGMGNSGMFGPQTVLNQGMSNSGGFIQQAPEPSRPKGPIIKELSSDDEDDASGDKKDDKNEGNCGKHPRTSKGPYVEDPDDEAEGTEKMLDLWDIHSITLEEHKEADTTTGKATHQISRGIGNKGHSLTRKLNSDGHVNTLQTLHNLNEDELDGFEETWQRNTGGNLPGWDPRVNMLGNGTAPLPLSLSRICTH
ncbi:hypothetical protein PR202_ga30866 [Eleusine coracana subsp. coracana]|uniref:Glycine-rich protein n=1 Tax=Eleusine coracana subsp. coracana TaxID=191504 RepID=A0AAV5DRP3_ELECO|nr:hypothetical protein PR202_ga30866 [Eleusine coracana subsp. coracana]